MFMIMDLRNHIIGLFPSFIQTFTWRAINFYVFLISLLLPIMRLLSRLWDFDEIVIAVETDY